MKAWRAGPSSRSWHPPLGLGEREGVQVLVEQAQDQKARPVRPALREARAANIVRPRRLARDLGHVDPSLGADAQRDERREGGHQRGQAEALVRWVRLVLLHHYLCVIYAPCRAPLVLFHDTNRLLQHRCDCGRCEAVDPRRNAANGAGAAELASGM